MIDGKQENRKVENISYISQIIIDAEVDLSRMR